MKQLIHLDLYDPRRSNLYADIECRECAHFGPACGNSVVVLDAMRSTGNDMSIPVFDFTPDGDANASQCPGMWPSADYLRATGQAMAADEAMHREDMARLAQMGRGVA